MSESEASSTGGSANKVLTIRTTEDTRAQLEVLALLNERSVAEETRVALEDWVARSKSDPSVLKRAEEVRAEIEREAETKRNAIAAVLGGGGAKASPRAAKQVPPRLLTFPRRLAPEPKVDLDLAPGQPPISPQRVSASRCCPAACR